MRGARALAASERCRTPTLIELTRRASAMCPCASDMGDPLMAGCGRLEDVGETRHAAEFARQVAERQQLQQPASLACAFVRVKLVAQKRLQYSDPVIVRQVEQRLGVVITRQAGVRRGAIAGADQLAADVLDASRGSGLGPSVVARDRRGVLGCDPGIGRLGGLVLLCCEVGVGAISGVAARE